MSLFAKQPIDLAHAYHVGRSFFRQTVNSPLSSIVPEQAWSWYEENEGAVGYEASWAGIFPEPTK